MTPSQPGRKQWYDRLADAILGDEDLAPASPGSRYALICEKCFTHNGLVKESIWEDARESFFWFASRSSLLHDWLEYLCPKCGHFNQSARSKRQRLVSSPSPDTKLPSASPEPQGSTPSRPRKPSTSDLPTVDCDESMSMVVDSEADQPKAT